MSEKISRETYRKGAKHSAVMGLTSGLRIVLGFLPHVIIAKSLGLGTATDAYLMALSINQIVVKFLRIGTLPKVFIMALSDTFNMDRAKTEENVNNSLNVIIVIFLPLMAIMYLFAPVLVGLIAHGFSPEKKILTVNICRWLIPALLYQCLISLFEAVFKLRNEFSRWALLSLLPQAVILVCIALFISKFGIYSLVWGTLIGFALHLAILWRHVFTRCGYVYRWFADLRQSFIRKIVSLIYPYWASGFPAQLVITLQSFLVSLLPSGSASVFFYACRMMDYVEQFSVNIFSQLMLPYFSRKISQSSMDHIRRIYSQLVRITNYVHIPVLLILAVNSRQIVELLFSSKLTSPWVISDLGLALTLFMISLIPEPSSDVQFNIILAMKKTPLVNWINVSRMGVVLVLSAALFPLFGLWGLILANSLTHLQAFLINQWYLRKYHGFENIFRSERFLRIITLNVFFGGFCFLLNFWLQGAVASGGVYQKTLVIALSASLSAGFYILISLLFKQEELNIIKGILKNDTYNSSGAK